ncbi:MAG: glutathione S-transferase family protein [Hyphomonadaceae bacterium]|nr:glutathione S-transferase family protein [Hyphomonadaceae bacterium]
MKLYSAPYAPNPRRVTMFMAEKGITDIDVITVNLQEGAHRTEAYRAKSPLAQVPMLELDDGRCLTESRAICTYLESVYPEPNLMGVDGFERAEIEMWDRRAELMVTLPMMMWVRHGNPLLAAVEKNQNPAIAAANQETAMKMARWFDRQLETRPFLAGDRLTIVDLTALAGIDFARMNKWRPGDDLPNLQRWRAMMAERPAGKAPA